MIKNLGKFAHPPKSGSKPQMKPRLPMESKQSKQAASQIKAPPAPFKNPAGAANAPAPAKMINGPTSKHTAGLKGSAAPVTPNAGPVGGGKPKTGSMVVGVGNPPKIAGAITKKATKGGHSLLYGD